MVSVHTTFSSAEYMLIPFSKESGANSSTMKGCIGRKEIHAHYTYPSQQAHTYMVTDAGTVHLDNVRVTLKHTQIAELKQANEHSSKSCLHSAPNSD